MADDKLKKVSIVVSRGSLEGVYHGLIMANGARMEGIEASIFFTFFGLYAILKEYQDKIKIATVGNPAMRVPDAKGMPLPTWMGAIPGMSAFATGMMQKEMEAQGFDQIVYDSPPVLAVADPAIIAGRSDAVVIVAQAGATSRDGLGHAVARLRRVTTRIVGGVLNRADRDLQASYYGDPYRGYDNESARRSNSRNATPSTTPSSPRWTRRRIPGASRYCVTRSRTSTRRRTFSVRWRNRCAPNARSAP